MKSCKEPERNPRQLQFELKLISITKFKVITNVHDINMHAFIYAFIVIAVESEENDLL